MYRNILVAIDGSNTAELALLEAINLAKDLNGQLRIVNVVDVVHFIQDTEFYNQTEIWDAMRREGKAILDKALGKAYVAGIHADT